MLQRDGHKQLFDDPNRAADQPPEQTTQRRCYPAQEHEVSCEVL